MIGLSGPTKCCIKNDDRCNNAFQCCGDSECDLLNNICVPIIIPTDNPSPDPTLQPTESPNFSPGSLTCGDTVNGELGQNDVAIFTLSVPYDTIRVVVQLCNQLTQFRTVLTLYDNNQAMLATDTDGCGVPGFQSWLDIASGLPVAA